MMLLIKIKNFIISNNIKVLYVDGVIERGLNCALLFSKESAEDFGQYVYGKIKILLNTKEQLKHGLLKTLRKGKSLYKIILIG